MTAETMTRAAEADPAVIAQNVINEVRTDDDIAEAAKLVPGNAAAMHLPGLGRIGDGRWLLLDELGRGNRTWIVQALDVAANPALDGHGVKPPAWALKIACVPSGADCPADLAHEASVLARARNVPGIARAYGLERLTGHPMLRMARAPGRRLTDLLPVTRAAALAVLRDLARTLAILHARGIAHGDLKPGNILLGSDWVTTLIDFGSANDQAGAGPPPMLSRTPAWAGPGQMQGLAASPADDCFAFAMLCHRLLADAHPFNGHSVATARKAGHAPPPLRRGGRRLRRLVDRTLGGDPVSAWTFHAALTHRRGRLP